MIVGALFGQSLSNEPVLARFELKYDLESTYILQWSFCCVSSFGFSFGAPRCGLVIGDPVLSNAILVRRRRIRVCVIDGCPGAVIVKPFPVIGPTQAAH